PVLDAARFGPAAPGAETGSAGEAGGRVAGRRWRCSPGPAGFVLIEAVPASWILPCEVLAGQAGGGVVAVVVVGRVGGGDDVVGGGEAGCGGDEGVGGAGGGQQGGGRARDRRSVVEA